MLKSKMMSKDTAPAIAATEPEPSPTDQENTDQIEKPKSGLFGNIRGIFTKPKNGGDSLREVIEEYIEDHNNGDDIDPTVALHEKTLISNILNLQDLTVIDVMIPRADIIAIDINSSQDELMDLLEEKQFSRIPVYRENNDDIIGTVHIKDILSTLAAKKEVQLEALLRDVPIVSPSLPVLDLMLLMQKQKKHMVLVVDEYGGIDGLVTVGDVIESIVGEIDDEFDQDIEPIMIQKSDGVVIADARYELEDFEEEHGKIFTDEEHEENDTLGGLVFYTAGRIPARGEVIQHESGMNFEIMEADQRRISKLRIKNIPAVSDE